MKITNQMLEYLQWIKDQTIGKTETPEFFLKVDSIPFSDLVFKQFILVKKLGGFKYAQITNEGIKFLKFADRILKGKVL
jgi:hypothetical protein